MKKHWGIGGIILGLLFLSAELYCLKVIQLMSVKENVLENWIPTWKTPSDQMRRMGMASCTERGIRNLSRSALVALLRVLIIGILLIWFRGRSIFSSRFVAASLFLLTGRLFPLLNGRLQCLVVQAVRPKDKAAGCQNLGLEPRPQSLFCGHAVVGEKAAGSERSCSQNADPAHTFCTHQRVEYKIKPDCGAQCQQRAGELSG